MVLDVLTIAKYSVLFTGSFYGYLKLAKIKPRLINLIEIAVSVILATGLYFATKHIRILLPLGYLLLTCLYCFIRYRFSALNTVTRGVIACGITVITMAIAAVVSIPLDFLAFKYIPDETARNCITVATINVLQLIVIFLIYRIKRFKSGLSVQSSDGSIELLLLISVLSVFLFTLFYRDGITDSPFEIIILTLIFCGLGIVVLWKKHVTNAYSKKIYRRNEELYENRIEEYEKERNELLSRNAELAKIIHKDNKLIPAMAAAVKSIIADAPNKEDLGDVLNQLEELSSRHRDIINSYQAEGAALPKTGNTALDAVIHFLNSKALQSGVSPEFKVDGKAIPPLLDSIKDHTDLNTILCDLGENAVIAAKNVANGKIRIDFEADGAPGVSFYDNGAKFDKKVLANMGKKRITTHKSDGGSGIGLMTLFEILNKYNASLCLDEASDNGDYTKRIKISFDKLHNITVCRTENN